MGSAFSCLRPPPADGGPTSFPEQPLGAPAGFQGTSFVAIRLLGRGAYADTWLFRDVTKSRLVAIKLFKRESLTREMLPVMLREAGIQAELGVTSIHLIEIHEAILTPTHVGFVMEYAAGGALTGYIAEAWVKAAPGGCVLPRDTARFLFIQFCRAVSHCHDLGVAHRDLKLDNTLLDGSSPPVVKIADFGFARRVTTMDRATSHLGTPEYMSPELLHPAGAPPPPSSTTRPNNNSSLGSNTSAWPPRQAGYDPRAADVWAAGVFLCVVLLGAFPFDHAGGADPRAASLQDHELELYTQEVTRHWRDSPFLKGNIAALPPDAADLLNRIFEVDPQKRLTFADILAHPFVSAPLTAARYADALAALDAAQARVDEHIRHRAVDPSKIRARIAALRALLDEGARTPDAASLGRAHMRPLHQLDAGAFLARVDLCDGGILVDGSHACDCAGAAERERLASGLPPTGSSARVDEIAAVEAARSHAATPVATTPFADASGRGFSVSSGGGGGGREA